VLERAQQLRDRLRYAGTDGGQLLVQRADATSIGKGKRRSWNVRSPGAAAMSRITSLTSSQVITSSGF
jgi:hypothetical protein